MLLTPHVPIIATSKARIYIRSRNSKTALAWRVHGLQPCFGAGGKKSREMSRHCGLTEGRKCNASRSEGLRVPVTRLETSSWAAPAAAKRCENESLEAEPGTVCEFTAFLAVHTESLVSLHFFSSKYVRDSEISRRGASRGVGAGAVLPPP